MPIPAETATSNPVVRDALQLIPNARGTKVGDIVMPDYSVDAETVDYQTAVEHSLNLDDLRAPDAEAKEVQFGEGALATISVREHAQKSKVDKRKIEQAGARGVDILADRAALHRADIEDVKEYRIAQLSTSSANYGADHKSTGDDFSAAGIRSIIDGGRDAIVDDGYFDAGDLIIGAGTLRAFRVNPDLESWVGERGDIDEAAIAQYLGVNRVIVARYRRKIGNGTGVTEFWPLDFALLVSNRPTLSTRTFGATIVTPYGATFGRNGVLTDVRTADISGTEGLMEVAAYQRYRPVLLNDNLAFLWYGITGIPA